MDYLIKRVVNLVFVIVAVIALLSLSVATAGADPAPLHQLENSPASTSTSTSTNTDDNCKNTTTSDALKKCIQTNSITKDLLLVVNVLSAGVGVIVIGMIIFGGIQYSIAGDNSQATGAAKQRILNALIALLAYLFIFAFLQWLIPGGLFSK
jgi:hypothetical protein